MVSIPEPLQATYQEAVEARELNMKHVMTIFFSTLIVAAMTYVLTSDGVNDVRSAVLVSLPVIMAAIALFFVYRISSAYAVIRYLTQNRG